MRVGVVGGLNRSEFEYERMARELGHEVEHHDGNMHGHPAAALERLVERSDLVIIITDVNSHGAVRLTRRLLRTHPRPSVLVRKLGASRFQALVREHAAAAADPRA